MGRLCLGLGMGERKAGQQRGGGRGYPALAASPSLRPRQLRRNACASRPSPPGPVLQAGRTATPLLEQGGPRQGPYTLWPTREEHVALGPEVGPVKEELGVQQRHAVGVKEQELRRVGWRQRAAAQWAQRARALLHIGKQCPAGAGV